MNMVKMQVIPPINIVYKPLISLSQHISILAISSTHLCQPTGAPPPLPHLHQTSPSQPSPPYPALAHLPELRTKHRPSQLLQLHSCSHPQLLVVLRDELGEVGPSAGAAGVGLTACLLCNGGEVGLVRFGDGEGEELGGQR